MEVAALSLLLYLVMSSLDSGRARVSLTITPRRSQFFKYEVFSVSCEEEEEQREEEEGEEWRVMKRMTDGEVRPCPSSCSITHAFPATDSGVYWCENGLGTTGNTVNITVTAGAVILESPALPVTEGDSLTLHCRSKDVTSAGNLTADFYKDGLLVATSSTGNMTIHSVSKSDEGLFRCHISGAGASAESWLSVRAPPAGQDPPAHLLRYLLVGTPYLLSTILLGLIYRDRRRELQANKARQPSDDVIMQIAL
ncbi:Fc receptor-like protein 5 isoform X2 [Trachinotus anak]|uniref:Fc receptor-like protein 5 isoform X2 n=1 Tax=Trachinotus anak TaxID=443729 RepID=UPI0039F245EE